MKAPKQVQDRKLLPKIILILVLGLLLAGEGYFGYKLHTVSAEQEQIKEDYSTINNITFGVFSIDLWSEKLSEIVNSEINGFKITPEQKEALRTQIEAEMHNMVDQVVKEFTKPQKGLGNKLKKFAFKEFVDPKELHDQVPAFANTIVTRVTSKRATGKIKDIATTKFEELSSQTYDNTSVAINTITKKLNAKYGIKDSSTFNKQLETRLAMLREVTYNYAYTMLGFLAAFIVIWIALRNKTYLHTPLFIISLLFALVLLITGITVSIIEVDARLSSLEFLMIGDKVVFTNQVLFYQSKSILGIAKVLIEQPKPDAITVGIIIILFVIILPILRITARGLHMLCKPLISENKVTRYLAFESGKWDMADVMVVGILMTYIGLNGILQSQLKGLNLNNAFITTKTVNYTALQPGYLVFVGYVAFAFLLSFILKKLTCTTAPLGDKV